MDEAIFQYFERGFLYQDILSLLSVYHGVNWSIDQLRRFLKRHGLKRKGVQTARRDIIRALEVELEGPGALSGYRSMWQCLKTKHGLQVTRETVRILLHEIDPEGTAQRRARRLKRRIYRTKGPNYIWHLDGYDKLKPYGIAIHGAIDGYSRRMLWLEAGPTNQDPSRVAKYFVDSVKQLGCPRVVRVDPGTENGLTCTIQSFLRRTGTDALAGRSSYRYGKSTANQRIEAWWSFFRRYRSEWWISLFKDLVDFGAYDPGNEIQRWLFQYCFMDVIQRDLDAVVAFWNAHSIRKQNMAECPNGRPDILYFLPYRHGTRNYSEKPAHGDLCFVERFVKEQSKTGNNEFEEILSTIVAEHDLDYPLDWKDGLILYFRLLHITE